MCQGFSHFFSFFALFCTGQIFQQQNNISSKTILVHVDESSDMSHTGSQQGVKRVCCLFSMSGYQSYVKEHLIQYDIYVESFTRTVNKHTNANADPHTYILYTVLILHI